MIQEFKCPSCGGSVEFDAGSQQMKCPYCDTEFDIEALQEKETAASGGKQDSYQWDETAGGKWAEGETDGMMVYTCQSCAGQIVGDDNLGSTSCPYCGNRIVMTGQFEGVLRPDAVIPFKADKRQAKEAFEKFINGRKYVPRMFRKEKYIEEVKGVYVPFWSFDAEVDAAIGYDAEDVYITREGDYQTTVIKHYDVHREGHMSFKNVPVDGSSKIDDDLMESIEPFNMEEAVDFQTAYLAGYLADKYDVDEGSSIDRANSRIKKSTENTFRKTIGHSYEMVKVSRSNINMKNGRARYILLPVWMLSATYRGKAYTFAMNGQTGKFTGDLPVDEGALWRYFGKCTAVVSAIIYIGSMVLLAI